MKYDFTSIIDREGMDAMELFRKYDVTVISDEIWSDLYLGDHHYIPTQSVSEDAKMRTSPVTSSSSTGRMSTFPIRTIFYEEERAKRRKISASLLLSVHESPSSHPEAFSELKTFILFPGLQNS